MNSFAAPVVWIVTFGAIVGLPAYLIAKSRKAQRDWIRTIWQVGTPAIARIVGASRHYLGTEGARTVIWTVEVEFTPRGDVAPVRATRTFEKPMGILSADDMHPFVQSLLDSGTVEIRFHPKWPAMIAIDGEFAPMRPNNSLERSRER
jgi:hypothetical protein